MCTGELSVHQKSGLPGRLTSRRKMDRARCQASVQRSAFEALNVRMLADATAHQEAERAATNAMQAVLLCEGMHLVTLHTSSSLPLLFITALSLENLSDRWMSNPRWAASMNMPVNTRVARLIHSSWMGIPDRRYRCLPWPNSIHRRVVTRDGSRTSSQKERA